MKNVVVDFPPGQPHPRIRASWWWRPHGMSRGPCACTVEQLRDAQPSYDVLVVDEGSRDRTAAAAGVLVCRLPFNPGPKGKALAGHR